MSTETESTSKTRHQSKLILALFGGICVISICTAIPAHRRGRHDHRVHALLVLGHLEDLVLLGALQDDRRRPRRPVPARLAVGVLEGRLLHLPDLARNAVHLVDGRRADAHKVAHCHRRAALLGDLLRLLQEAVLVRILARVSRDADPLQRAEDAVRAVVLFQIRLVAVDRVAGARQRGSFRVQRVTSVRHGLGLGLCAAVGMQLSLDAFGQG